MNREDFNDGFWTEIDQKFSAFLSHEKRLKIRLLKAAKQGDKKAEENLFKFYKCKFIK